MLDTSVSNRHYPLSNLFHLEFLGLHSGPQNLGLYSGVVFWTCFSRIHYELEMQPHNSFSLFSAVLIRNMGKLMDSAIIVLPPSMIFPMASCRALSRKVSSPKTVNGIHVRRARSKRLLLPSPFLSFWKASGEKFSICSPAGPLQFWQIKYLKTNFQQFHFARLFLFKRFKSRHCWNGGASHWPKSHNKKFSTQRERERGREQLAEWVQDRAAKRRKQFFNFIKSYFIIKC